jgi:AraC-like DNA-binding protein
MTHILTIELLLRGIAIGASAAIAFGLWRAAAPSMRWAFALLCLSAAFYALMSPAVRVALGWLYYPAWFFQMGGVGYFWLFTVTLFEDRKLSPATLAPAFVLTAVGLASLAAPRDVAAVIWVLSNLIEAGLAGSALFIIYRSWREDLVDERRRVRGPFMAALTLYLITLSGLEIAEGRGFQPDWDSLARAASLALFCLAGAWIFLEARATLFGAVAPTKAEASFDPVDQLVLERLNRAMDADEIWRRERLTVGALAEAVNTQEHRLRRLINDRLGHRNFAAFINARRIEAAKRALADPNAAQATVASIAYDLGFASLGPFNRTFKDATGLTPTDWRRRKSGSPNLEKSR